MRCVFATLQDALNTLNTCSYKTQSKCSHCRKIIEVGENNEGRTECPTATCHGYCDDCAEYKELPPCFSYEACDRCHRSFSSVNMTCLKVWVSTYAAMYSFVCLDCSKTLDDYVQAEKDRLGAEILVIREAK